MNTLFDKIWDGHVVSLMDGGPTQLYIDRLYCHEVTSPQAFEGIRRRGCGIFRPGRIVCMPDHDIPTEGTAFADEVCRRQVETLERNAAEFGLAHYPMMSPNNGIVHVVGLEKGLSLPGMTIVCGDSHTSTHGAVGAVAFGIGTSEVEMVLATQCILQQKPRSMRIRVEGELGRGVSAKDVALYLMMRLTTSGATGYFIEYAGSAVRNLSMEGRLTLCNLSIEMGARGGFVAPDETTFAYLKGREHSPVGFRAFASIVRGRRKADGVTAWLVPGSWAVRRQIEEEGLDKVLEDAGFEIRKPGCSACLAMNADKIPEGKYAVSTSNRNFEGRQGPGARTMLASPLTAAAAAVSGCVTDPRELI